MGNPIYLPNLKKNLTGTEVGAATCLDVNIASGTVTFTEGATAADGGALPAVTKVVSGYDGSNVQALHTDSSGDLQIDVLTLPALSAGTNNIGDVDVLSLPSLPAGTNNIGDVDVLTLPSLPAGTNNIGDVDVLTEPGSVADGGVLPSVVKVVAGHDGANVRALHTDSSGDLQIDVLSSALPTGASTEATLSSLNGKFGSLGQKAMAGSSPVVIASDQSAIPSSQSGTWSVRAQDGAGNSLTSTSAGATRPLDVILRDGSGNELSIGGSSSNTNGSQSTSTVGTTATTLTAPANSVGFLLQGAEANSANLRWRIGATATASSGQQLQPGRDTGYVPCAANISIISESGTQEYQVQWILSS